MIHIPHQFMIPGSDLTRHHMENSNAETRFHALCEVQTWQQTQPLQHSRWVDSVDASTLSLPPSSILSGYWPLRWAWQIQSDSTGFAHSYFSVLQKALEDSCREEGRDGTLKGHDFLDKCHIRLTLASLPNGSWVKLNAVKDTTLHRQLSFKNLHIPKVLSLGVPMFTFHTWFPCLLGAVLPAKPQGAGNSNDSGETLEGLPGLVWLQNLRKQLEANMSGSAVQWQHTRLA